MRLTRRPNLSRSGFTLVEMLIVLGILVALFALVLPRFLGSQKKAKVDLAKTQIGAFRGALERYYVDCDRFPTTEQGLDALVSQPADLSENVTWTGPYVSAEIGNDPWGNQYQYESPPTRGTGDLPDIWSFGPDGEDGTEDDVCSWTSAGAAKGGGGDAASVEESGTKAAPRTTRSGTESRPKATSPKSSRAAAPKPIRSENP